MEQLLHEQLLQAASARGLSYSRLAALWCQEREDYVEEKERLAVAREPASPFMKKQCLTYSILCDHLLHARLLVILLYGQRMSALEIRACAESPHLLTLFASLPPHLISHLYSQALPSRAASGIPPLTAIFVGSFWLGQQEQRECGLNTVCFYDTNGQTHIDIYAQQTLSIPGYGLGLFRTC